MRVTARRAFEDCAARWRIPFPVTRSYAAMMGDARSVVIELAKDSGLRCRNTGRLANSKVTKRLTSVVIWTGCTYEGRETGIIPIRRRQRSTACRSDKKFWPASQRPRRSGPFVRPRYTGRSGYLVARQAGVHRARSWMMRSYWWGDGVSDSARIEYDATSVLRVVVRVMPA